jgi:hypothetical protein
LRPEPRRHRGHLGAEGRIGGAFYGSAASNGVIIITTKRGRQGRPTFNITQRLGQFRLSNTLDFRCFKSAEELLNNGTRCNSVSEQLPDPSRLLRREGLFHTRPPQRIGRSFGDDLLRFWPGKARCSDRARNRLQQAGIVRINIGQLIGTKLNVKANTEIIHSLTVLVSAQRQRERQSIHIIQ